MSTTDTPYLPQKLKELQSACLVGGAVGLAVMLGGWLFGSANFYQGYLIGWLFAFGFSLGGLLILCIHHLAHGGWGFLMRRIAESSAMTILPLMLLLLPIMFSLDKVYPWAIRGPDGLSVYHTDPVIGEKIRYLNHGFIWIRYFVYFAVWVGGAKLFWDYSGKQDETGDMVWRRKMRALAGPMALAYTLTLTLFSVDFIMSLEPMWFSSIFGVMIAAGHFLTLLAFGLVFLRWLSKWEPVKTEFTVDRQHDIGKLLFAFIIFWTYIQVSQLIIYWHANLPEEITWYMNRWSPGFNAVSWVLVISQFVIPFLLLISRTNKRNTRVIVGAAAALLFVRVIDMYWLIAPSINIPETRDLYPVPTRAMGGAPFHFFDVLGPITFAALWFGMFLYYFRQRPILPVNDPYFSRGIESKEPMP